MINFIRHFLLLLPLTIVLATLPFLPSYSDCAVEGAVCGEPPNWQQCCNPDKFECKKANPDDEYGTCEEREEEG